MAMAAGPLPVGMNAPPGIRTPVASSMANTETLLDVLLTTYKNVPLGSTATAMGALPLAANGEPPIEVRAPLAASMKNAEISLAPWLATYANRPACVQFTTTFDTSRLSMVPEPLWTVQVCVGFDGWVLTVTEYALLVLTPDLKVKAPLAVTLRSLPELSWSTSPDPRRPVTIPPTLYLPSSRHDVMPTTAAQMTRYVKAFIDISDAVASSSDIARCGSCHHEPGSGHGSKSMDLTMSREHDMQIFWNHSTDNSSIT